MRVIPKKLRADMATDPEYGFCMRWVIFNDHECEPDPVTRKKIDWEHAFAYAGQQINEKWAIISVCWWAHRGPGLDKKKNQFIALARATVEDLLKYPRVDWEQKKQYLNKIYG